MAIDATTLAGVLLFSGGALALAWNYWSSRRKRPSEPNGIATLDERGFHQTPPPTVQEETPALIDDGEAPASRDVSTTPPARKPSSLAGRPRPVSTQANHPSKVGPFENLEYVGEGAMATVYRATDTRDGRVLAIKLILPAHQRDAEFLKRFQRESEISISLNHPNVVRVYEVG